MLTGFDSEAPTQPPSAELGLIFLVGFVPLFIVEVDLLQLDFVGQKLHEPRAAIVRVVFVREYFNLSLR